MSPNDLPRTWIQFLEFLEKWPETYGKDYPNISPVYYDEVKYIVFSACVGHYIAYNNHQNNALIFDTELFHQLMSKFKDIDFSIYASRKDINNESILFDIGTMVTFSIIDDETFYPLLLSMGEGLPAVSASGESVYIVNPYSKNVDAAIKYLETVIECMSEEHKINIYSDYSTPIINQWYEYEITDATNKLNEYQDMLQNPDEQIRRNAETEIERLMSIIDDIEKSKFRVSPEQIVSYQNIADNVGFNACGFGNEIVMQVITDIQVQFVDGRLSVDQLIQQMDEKIRMVQIEQDG